MDVGRLEYLPLPGRKPRGLGRTMTFGATAVPAGVRGLLLMATVVALRDMPAQGSRATQRDVPQGPVLRA
jgi:hypothetical protein